MHEATGKGGDSAASSWQPAADPQVKVVAPWRNEAFRSSFPAAADDYYCQRTSVKASAAKPYSSDENCLHISYEAGQLENLSVNGVELVDFGMTTLPQNAPDRVEPVTVAFESGVPVAVGGKQMTAFEIVNTLNQVGGRNGIGQIDMVENRFVGMKSRGVYEAPGMTILYHALPRPRADHHGPRPDAPPRSSRPEVAEMVYYGFWYHAKMDACLPSSRRPSGRSPAVTLNLYKKAISRWRAAPAPTASTTKASPRWKAAA